MIRKHSISLSGHRTSFSLEDAFWTELQVLAKARGLAVAALIGEIDAERTADCNLSSAIRLHVLASLKASAGH